MLFVRVFSGRDLLYKCVPTRQLRSSTIDPSLLVPSSNLKSNEDRAFLFALVNCGTTSLNSYSVSSFKSNLKTCLFKPHFLS